MERAHVPATRILLKEWAYRFNAREDFLLYCQFPLFGNGWLSLLGVGLVVIGVLILARAAWEAVASDKLGEQNTSSAGLQATLNKRVFKRVETGSASHSSPNAKGKTDNNFGKRAKQVVVLGQKRERIGWGIGAWLVLFGFLLQIMGSWQCL